MKNYRNLSIDELLHEAQVKLDNGVLVPIAQELASRLREIDVNLLNQQISELTTEINTLKHDYEIE